MEALHKEESPSDKLFDCLSDALYWVVHDVGLGKLLTIPELYPKQPRQELRLDKN